MLIDTVVTHDVEGRRFGIAHHTFKFTILHACVSDDDPITRFAKGPNMCEDGSVLVIAHDIAADLGGFSKASCGAKSQFAHRKKNATMHWL